MSTRGRAAAAMKVDVDLAAMTLGWGGGKTAAGMPGPCLRGGGGGPARRRATLACAAAGGPPSLGSPSTGPGAVQSRLEFYGSACKSSSSFIAQGTHRLSLSSAHCSPTYATAITRTKQARVAVHAWLSERAIRLTQNSLIDGNRPISTPYGMPLKDSCQLMIRVRTAKSEPPTPDFTVKWPHSPKNGLPRRQTTPGLPKWNGWLDHPALAQLSPTETFGGLVAVARALAG
ncbi:hypothetical protein PCL_02120 [Purpureocillium lilacinum]|uniref:Uncharacterized protein n=1 Tax=Purpureocillium lilacinum TaxID=33203 RepID=A0A2U3E1G3_PURLI|nr:hypothetical protein PCL_02120 [Purpureocillium lilacinum]